MASSKREEESLTLTTDNVVSSHKRKREDPAEDSDEQTAGRPQPRQPEHSQHLTPQMSYFQTFQTSSQYSFFQSSPQQLLGYPLLDSHLHRGGNTSLLPQQQNYLNFPHNQQWQSSPYLGLADRAVRHPENLPPVPAPHISQPSSHTTSEISQYGSIVNRDGQVHPNEIQQNAGEIRDRFHLWDRRNPKESTLMSEQKIFLQRIKQNFTLLTSNLNPSVLWPILHETGAVDEDAQEGIEHNAARKNQVQRLMMHIKMGPTYRFHAFLRACALTNQEHIIRILGLEPDDYGEAAAPSGMQRLSCQAPHTMNRGYQGPLPFPHSSCIYPPYEQSMGHQLLSMSKQPMGHFMFPMTADPTSIQPAILSFQQPKGDCTLPMTGNQATNQLAVLQFQEPTGHCTLPMTRNPTTFQPALQPCQLPATGFPMQFPSELPPEGHLLDDQAKEPQSQENIGKGDLKHPIYQTAGQKGVQSQDLSQNDSEIATPTLYSFEMSPSGQKQSTPVFPPKSSQSREQGLHCHSKQESESLFCDTQQKSSAQQEMHSNLTDTLLQNRQRKGQVNPPSARNEEEQAKTSAMTCKLSKRLKKAITRHSEGCRRNLMMRKVFDIKEDDRGEIINTAKCYIQLQVNMKDHMITLELPEKDIFEKIQMQDLNGETTYQQDAPQGVRLYGPPGAGKTTFLRHIVHAWSIDFLEKGPEKWTTMVYIPARDIRSTIKDAIKEHLWCRKEDIDILMKHVEGGEGVAIAIDAVDEIRDAFVLHNLQEYVHMRQTRGGPKILISARNDLCSINPQDFSRFLVLEGFTSEQGLLYIKQYFAMGQPLPIHQRVLDYVNRHKNKMEAVLQNPLKLHIFCALTEKGILELGEEFRFEILNLFEPLEMYLTTREGGSVTKEQSKNFYKLCLFAMLSGIREFSKNILSQFKIVKNYYAFLVKKDTRDSTAKLTTCYSFTHEMIFEYFASRYIENMELEGLWSLMLSVCCKKSLRNVHRIMFEIIHRKERLKEELLTLMIRCIIILQPITLRGTQNETIQKLISLPNEIQTSISIQQLVFSCQEGKQISKAETVIREINQAFDDHAQDLKESGWFRGLQHSGILRHIGECLQICDPHEREEITAASLNLLLPCRSMDIHWEEITIYALDHQRWGQITTNGYDQPHLQVYAWCIEDSQDLLRAHKATNPQQPFSRVSVHLTNYIELWGKPGESNWTKEAWNKFLLDVADFSMFDVYLSITCSLTGLFHCVMESSMRFEIFLIVYGTALLAEVEACVQGIEKHGKNINLKYTHIVMPSDQEEGALRARRDKLCQMVNGRGERILDNPVWKAKIAASG